MMVVCALQLGTKALTPFSWLVEGMSLHARQKRGTRKDQVLLALQ